MRTGRIMRRGAAWAGHAERAASLLERLRGLLGRDGLAPGSALVIERCGSVHTVGMRFALDLVFLDRAWRVTRIVRNVRPGRFWVWGGWRACRVVETAAGGVAVADLRPGDGLTWEGTASVREAGGDGRGKGNAV